MPKLPWYVKYIIAWHVSLIAWFILGSFLEIEFTTEYAYAGMGYSLFATLIFLGYTKGKFHWGHVFTITGLNIFLISGLIFFGEIGWPQYGKARWWDVPHMEHEAILIISIIAGLGIMSFGVVSQLHNWQWWGRGK